MKPSRAFSGASHLEWIPHSDSDGGCDLELCQDREPEREQTGDP